MPRGMSCQTRQLPPRAIRQVPGTTEQNVRAAWQPPGAKQPPLPKVEGDGATSGKGSNAPVKGKPRGSVGRMLLLPPKRGNIPKDLLGPFSTNLHPFDLQFQDDLQP